MFENNAMITKADKHNSNAIINHNKYEEKFWILLKIIFLIILNETALIKRIRSNVNNTWCDREVMRLATLCMNRQRCCLPLHMAVRLTPAIDSVQV